MGFASGFELMHGIIQEIVVCYCCAFLIQRITLTGRFCRKPRNRGTKGDIKKKEKKEKKGIFHLLMTAGYLAI